MTEINLPYQDVQIHWQHEIVESLNQIVYIKYFYPIHYTRADGKLYIRYHILINYNICHDIWVDC